MSYAIRENSVQAGDPVELYKFEAAGEAWRVTSGQRPRVYLGEVYEPLAITRSELSQTLEQQSGRITITLPRDHAIAQQFRGYLPAEPVRLTLARGHEGEAEIIAYTGFEVLSAKFGDACELTVGPPQEKLKRRIPPQEYQRRCNHILFDAGCTLDREDFREPATLTFVSGVTVRAAEFATLGSGWFDSGYLEKGNERRMILRHVGDTIELITAMPSLAVGDAVDVFAGCLRTASVCNSKFSNLVNFLGFEFIPQKNPFRGVE